MDEQYEETASAFTIEDIDPPSNANIDLQDSSADDDLVVEDIPDLLDCADGVHDQLPSVEEYKASVDHTSPRGKKFWYFSILSVVLVVIIVLSSVAISASGKGEQPSRRLEAVTQFLFDNNVSNLLYLQDQTSSQHKAAAFVADGDAYRMELTEENTNRFAERYILSLLYYHTNGQNWMHRVNFLAPVDHCDWWHKYTNTEGKEVRQGVKCDNDGRVVEVNLCKYFFIF
jgi:hypothetical protein